jgi:hypothetical protein
MGSIAGVQECHVHNMTAIMNNFSFQKQMTQEGLKCSKNV